jgi:hypothetical protein
MNFKARYSVPTIGIVYVETGRGIYITGPDHGEVDPGAVDMLNDLFKRKQGNHLDPSDFAAFIQNEFNLTPGAVKTLWMEGAQEPTDKNQIP